MKKKIIYLQSKTCFHLLVTKIVYTQTLFMTYLDVKP